MLEQIFNKLKTPEEQQEDMNAGVDYLESANP